MPDRGNHARRGRRNSCARSGSCRSRIVHRRFAPCHVAVGHLLPHIPLLLALLKLPLGALTAVIGILLIHGGFVPGLTALDTPAQIAAWAVVFGAAQQAVSQLLDNQAGRLEHRAVHNPQSRNQRASA
jgi:hypothetical protein